MKTLYLNLSPKKRNSMSGYLMRTAGRFSDGESIQIRYRGTADDAAICEAIQNCESLVLLTPLYVDGLPSHVIEFLSRFEQKLQTYQPNLTVYMVCNCGFYEGQQCELALEMVRFWCMRADVTFGGGLGVGAGEMLRVLRWNVPIGGIFAILGILFLLLRQQTASYAMFGTMLGFLLTFPLFSIRMWNDVRRFSRSVSRTQKIGLSYTTLSFCPSWMFVLFASIYWVLRAFFLHITPVWKMFSQYSPK